MSNNVKCTVPETGLNRSCFRFQYILRSLQRSSLLEIVSLAEPDCEENYNDMILEQKRLYSQSWAKVLVHIW